MPSDDVGHFTLQFGDDRLQCLLFVVVEALQRRTHAARAQAGQLGTVLDRLDKQIAHFEQELSQPLESRAAVTIAAEVRKYVKDMTVEARHKFLQQAIDDADHITASAVLGAPPYLSGLDANFQKTYTRMWHERTSPDLATKLKAVRGAKAVIEQRGGLIFKEVEKAMGAPWARVQALREGNDKALAALKFDGQ